MNLIYKLLLSNQYTDFLLGLQLLKNLDEDKIFNFFEYFGKTHSLKESYFILLKVFTKFDQFKIYRICDKYFIRFSDTIIFIHNKEVVNRLENGTVKLSEKLFKDI